MALDLGDSPADFPFLRPDGAAITLSAFLGRPLVLIFLRHLG
jgi:peroxiredoxin